MTRTEKNTTLVKKKLTLLKNYQENHLYLQQLLLCFTDHIWRQFHRRGKQCHTLAIGLFVSTFSIASVEKPIGRHQNHIILVLNKLHGRMSFDSNWKAKVSITFKELNAYTAYWCLLFLFEKKKCFLKSKISHINI